MKKTWEKINKQIQEGLLKDNDLHNFLRPVFKTEEQRTGFIKQCLKKLETRRMLLRAQWYIKIADDQEKVRQSRPALKLIFLMALAESIAKRRRRKIHLGTFDAIKEFFSHVSDDDKKILHRSFRRTLLNPKHHNLRFSSILKILYDIRNKAVHGEDYFSFGLLDKKTEKQYKNNGYTSFGLISSGFLGPQNRKRKVSLEIKMTYEKLREIFRRTAVANIKAVLD